MIQHHENRTAWPKVNVYPVSKTLRFVASLQCNTIIAGTYAEYSSTSDFLHCQSFVSSGLGSRPGHCCVMGGNKGCMTVWEQGPIRVRRDDGSV